MPPKLYNIMLDSSRSWVLLYVSVLNNVRIFEIYRNHLLERQGINYQQHIYFILEKTFILILVDRSNTNHISGKHKRTRYDLKMLERLFLHIHTKVRLYLVNFNLYDFRKRKKFYYYWKFKCCNKISISVSISHTY
jgi:hypothetical protein